MNPLFFRLFGGADAEALKVLTPHVYKSSLKEVRKKERLSEWKPDWSKLDFSVRRGVNTKQAEGKSVSAQRARV